MKGDHTNAHVIGNPNKAAALYGEPYKCSDCGYASNKVFIIMNHIENEREAFQRYKKKQKRKSK